jgi:hypothetical protein
VDVDFEIVASGNLELEITIWVVLKNVEHEWVTDSNLDKGRVKKWIRSKFGDKGVSHLNVVEELVSWK